MRRIVVTIAATLGVGLLAGFAGAATLVIPGPDLDQDASYAVDWGPQITALADVHLISFTFENQGAADTISLTDEFDTVIGTYDSPAGDPLHAVSVDWPMTAGVTYYLTAHADSNTRYTSYSSYPTTNAHISVDGLWDPGNQELVYAFWLAYTDITTTDDLVDIPEPATLLIVLAGCAALALRRRR